jgi:uncharacterized protein (DUF1697 family)
VRVARARRYAAPGMPRCAAFLRGMNLGRRRISNDELRRHVERLGFAGVATFRASGNVILDAPASASIADVARRLEAGLTTALAYDVPVFARSAEQVRAIAACAPFEADALAAAKGKLQVILLREALGAAARRRALALATDEDRLAVAGAELFWLPSGGLADSPLDLKALARVVGPCTVRTKGTIELIAARHFDA